MRISLLIVLLLPALFATDVQAKLYRWTDEYGIVHYSDKVPAKYLKKEHEELNEQGTLVKEHDRAMTADEKKEKREREAEQRRLENQKRAQALRDRVLTDTYTTERDLVAARDARLDAIESQLQLSEDFIKSTEVKIKNTVQLIENTKAQGLMVPEATYAKLEREKLQHATQKGIQKGHQIKREEVIEQFEDYINRFRELMAAKQKKRDAYERRKLARERAAKGLPPPEQ